MKEKRDLLLEKVDVYELDSDKFEKTLLEKKVAMKVMNCSVVDLVRSVIRLEM